MSDDYSQITLDSLARGSLPERFAEELSKVARNIQDQDTTLDIREINIKVTFKPKQDRGSAEIKANVTSKLAGFAPVESHAYFSNEKGKYTAYEHNPEQINMFEPKVVKIEGEENA